MLIAFFGWLPLSTFLDTVEPFKTFIVSHRTEALLFAHPRLPTILEQHGSCGRSTQRDSPARAQVNHSTAAILFK